MTPSDGSAVERSIAHWCKAAYGLADLQLRAASEHVVGLADLFIRSSTTLPIIPVTRSAAEAASRALRLVGSTVPRADRAARGLAETLYNFEQQARVPIDESLKDHRPLIDAAITDARLLGVPLTMPKPKEGGDAPIPQVKGANARPNNTDAIMDLLKEIEPEFGRRAYSLWSAAAHATPCGLLAHAVDDAANGGIKFQREAQPMIATVAAACLGMASAYTERLACAGTPIEEWKTRLGSMDEKWRKVFAANRSRGRRRLVGSSASSASLSIFGRYDERVEVVMLARPRPTLAGSRRSAAMRRWCRP